MSYTEYEKAEKLGKKAYRLATLSGAYPYLPVLDDILSMADIRGETNLGLVNIPLNRVVGTSTQGRTYSFASNFMPILDYNTEFGAKWSSLCDSHMEEGIRDPIKVYEYLNYFYVIEGNKRVSVLKYFKADSVPAYVTRKIPKQTDDPENKIYYEFMDFYRVTSVNFLWVSKEGNFNRLLRATFPEHMEKWTDDDLKDFGAFYFNFSKAFDAVGGTKLDNITTGDACITFLEFFGYENVHELLQDEMKPKISSIMKEFTVSTIDEPIEVTMDPPEAKRGIPIIAHLLATGLSAPKPLRTAFIFDRDPASSSWLYQHELGRTHVKDVFGDKLITLKVCCGSDPDMAYKAMEELIEKENVEVLFTTTPEFSEVSLRVAVEHPDVKVLNCSLNTVHKYIRTYYTRLYEAKFLSGMIAGAMTGTGNIGYIADYPIFGTIANINAFALGANMTRPGTKVYLDWNTRRNRLDEDIVRDFREARVDFVSDQESITPVKASRKFGLYHMAPGGITNIALPVSDWGVVYEKIINSIMEGTWDTPETENLGKAINYWWGLSAGVTDIILSKQVPPGIARLVENTKADIIDGRFAVFDGPILLQDGSVLVGENDGLSPDEIMTMNQLIENVVGEIPKMDELRETARQLVELKGVNSEEDRNE